MITGDTLQMSSTFRIHERGTLSNVLRQSMHAVLRFCFYLCQFSIIILLMSGWSLHPCSPFRHPFCSHGSNSFCSRNKYVPSSHQFWAVDMLCLFLAVPKFALDFPLFVIVNQLVLYVLMLRYSARNQSACQVLGISICAISSMKILFLSI